MRRHLFVSSDLQLDAYGDHPLPIGSGQTISQPYIVAYMTEAAGISNLSACSKLVQARDAAILAEIAKEVYSIEIVAPLADRARNLLRRLGYANMEVRTGNGYLGWPEKAPFDAILVTAAPDEMPKALIDQLALGGRMVIPVGAGAQQMVIVTKGKDGVTQTKRSR